MHCAAQHQLAEHQRIHLGEERDALLHVGQVIGRGRPRRQVFELRDEQRLVGGLYGVTLDVADHLPTLVHGLLDERIAAERADDVETGDARLVLRRELRQRRRIGAAEPDAAALDELARRYRADARDDAVARHHGLALRGVERQRIGFLLPRRRRERRALRVVEAAECAVVDALEDRREVALLDADELVGAVDDEDLVAACKAERVLDRGVASADDHDGLVAVFIRIVERVLHAGQLVARHAEPARIALQADGEHHVLGEHLAATLEREPEITAGARDRGDLGIAAHRDPEPLQPRPPLAEDVLTHARSERQRTAQRQHVGLGHHVLALLVALDRVGVCRTLLEQHMRQTEFGRTRCGAQATGTCPDDGDADFVGHRRRPALKVSRRVWNVSLRCRRAG